MAEDPTQPPDPGTAPSPEAPSPEAPSPEAPSPEVPSRPSAEPDAPGPLANARPRAPSTRDLGRLARWPLLLVAFLYLATSPYHQGLNNPNEMVRVYMTKAMVEEGTMSIDRVVREWGGVDDKAIRDGKLYSSKAPLQSLLGVPAYKIAGPMLKVLGVPESKRTLTTVLRVFASAIPGIVFAWLLIGWARRRALQLGAPVAAGQAVALALVFGTMLYPYALTFTGHELAAIAAGGCYFAIAAMSRRAPGSARWRRLVLLAGLGAGAAPFAEYPSTLIVAPALVAALVITERKLWPELLVLLTAGGAAPFVLGLWAHRESWGSPFKTGYAFLENTSYHELHGHGFFGVSAPKAEAFAGALFSPGTGLFFFSPVLLIGLAALVERTFRRREHDDDASLPRAVAIAGLVGFLFEVLFISGHSGWRGGWTLGPRYIIGVAPLLGLWVIEALRNPKMRGFVAAFGAVSIVTTGFAAALYPHLSDVYTNPLKSFLVPSYLRGEASYGIGHTLHLTGTAANLVHLVPLTFAVLYVAARGATLAEGVTRRATIVAGTFVAVLGLVAAIPERDAHAAAQENLRLWGFWEPATPRDPERDRSEPVVPPGLPAPGPGLLFDARPRWRELVAEVEHPDGTIRPCQLDGERCRYGDQPWQYLAPEALDLGGARLPVLFMHPIAGSRVRAKIPVPAEAHRVIFRYGLTDSSVASTNASPLGVELRQGTTVVAKLELTTEPGLHQLERPLAATDPLTVEITCEKDGARVFGFDVELYR